MPGIYAPKTEAMQIKLFHVKKTTYLNANTSTNLESIWSSRIPGKWTNNMTKSHMFWLKRMRKGRNWNVRSIVLKSKELHTYSCLFFDFSNCCITYIFPLPMKQLNKWKISTDCILFTYARKQLPCYTHLINNSSGELPYTCSSELSTLFLNHQHL